MLSLPPLGQGAVAIPIYTGLPQKGTEGEWVAPWEKRRSWSLGNCPTVVVTDVTSASAEDFSGESAAQDGGGCP